MTNPARTNVDATYPDDPADPAWTAELRAQAIKEHQQAHDALQVQHNLWRRPLVGEWYTSQPMNTTAVISATNRGYVSPVWLPEAITVNQVSLEVTTASAAGTFLRIALYNSNADGNPATLLSEGPNVDSTTTGVKSSVFTQALPAGWVWVFVGSTGSPRYRAAGWSQLSPVRHNLASSQTIIAAAQHGGYFESSTPDAAPPATWTNLTTTAVPLVALRRSA